MNIFSNENYKYHEGTAIKILSDCTPNTEHYTHEFEHSSSGCNGKENRPFLTKMLRTLAHMGYLKQIKYPMNVHKWSITDNGIEYIKAYQLKYAMHRK